MQVAADECRHFLALEQRLEAIGSHYGALAAHDGLWESAAATAGSLGARLAVEHCTHEARGLDVLPQTVARFRAGGDADTAELLQVRGCGTVCVSVCARGAPAARVCALFLSLGGVPPAMSVWQVER